MVDSSSPSRPKWSLLFFCRGKEKTCQPAHTSQPSPPPAAQAPYGGHKVPLPHLQQHHVPLIQRGAGYRCPSQHSLTFLRMMSM